MKASAKARHHTSPLRYPGGKAKLAPFFKALIRQNRLLDGVYVEPFAGGAGVGLSLLLHGYVDRIILNDLSRPMFALWQAILTKPEDFKKSILETPLTVSEWERQREIFKNAGRKTTFELGFATFFLNRTNHSGVLNGGMIGGHSQSSKFGLDARFHKPELVARIERIARVRAKIKILNVDARDLLMDIRDVVGTKCPLVYADPPYFKKGRDLYYDFFEHEDHRALRDVVVNLPEEVRWVVSYDNEPEINRLYRDYSKLEYSLGYSVRNGRTGTEVMFFSKNLHAPIFQDGLAMRLAQTASATGTTR